MDAATATEYCETLLRYFYEDLTPWEDGFCRDVQRQVKADNLPPTQRQAEVLDRLMSKHADRHGKARHKEDDEC